MPRPRTIADDAKRRHPAAGGYARGDETRARIVGAALDVFGIHGFGGASTRMLAEKAGVTLPALQYYFGNKEGVYLACAAHIAERMETHLGALTERITEAAAKDELSRARLLEMLLGFVDRLVELFLGEHELEKWVMFIIREQAQPTKAFDVIFDRVMHRVVGACAALIGRLLDRPPSDREVRVRALALIGQVVFFRTARAVVLRELGWSDFDQQRLPVVKNALRAQITAGFGATRKTGRQERP